MRHTSTVVTFGLYGGIGTAALTCGLLLLTGWARLLLVLVGAFFLVLAGGAITIYFLVLLGRVVGGMRVLTAVGLVAAFGIGLLAGTDAATIGGAAFAQDVGLVLIGFRPLPYPRRNVVGVLLLVSLGSAISSTWILFG